MEDNLDFWESGGFDELPESEKEPGAARRRWGNPWKRKTKDSSRNLETEGGETGDGKGKRHLMMAAMLAVLGLSGGILGVVTAQSVQTKRQLEAQKSKDERMQQQLEEIEGYLSGLDQSVSDGQVTDAAGYEELSSTVQALQGNLMDYRDNHSIENDAIGENLDGVIEELASIQDNLEANRKAQEEMNGDLSTDVAANVTSGVSRSVDESSRSISSSLDEQVSGVREDIRKLIQEASSDNKEQYKELVSILNGTDTDLEGLSESIRALAAGNEEVKKAVESGLREVNGNVESGLQNVSGNVTGLKNTVSGIQEGVAALQSGVGTLEKSLGTLESQGNADSSALQELRTSIQTIQDESTLLQQKTAAMNDYLSANADGISVASDNIILLSRQASEVSDSVGEVKTALDTLPEDVKNAIAEDPSSLDKAQRDSEQMESLRKSVAAVSDHVTTLQRQMSDLEKTVSEGFQEKDFPAKRGKQMDAAADSVNTIEDIVTEELPALSSKADALMKSVDSLSSKLESLSAAVESLSAKVNSGTGSTGSTGFEVPAGQAGSAGSSGGTKDHGSVPVESGDEKTSEDHTADDLSGADAGSKDPEGSGNPVSKAENKRNDDGV